MSLLDLIQSDDPAIQNGLLNFGLSLLQSKGNFGNAVGRAGQAAQIGARDYRQQEALLKRASLNDKLLQSQLEEEQRRQQERAEAAKRQMEVQLYLQSLQPVSGINANAATGISGPRPEAAAAIGQRPQIDPIQAIRMLGPENAKAVLESGNWGRPKVARTVETANGIQPLDDYGQPVGSALPRYVAPQLIDTGDRKQFVTPAPGVSFNVGMSPEARDSSARGWAGVNLQKQRLALDQGSAVADAGGPMQAQLVKKFGKPPKDYRWKTDGSSEPIPGGPADIKAGEQGEKKEARARAGIEQANSVLDTVKEARDLVGISTTGPGGLMAKLPATDARNLQAKLETIKANLGFDRLQQMRESSPTGGALGQVAVQELMALQSTVASLDQLQSPSQVKSALDKIEKHYTGWLKTMGVERKSPMLNPKAIREEADRIINGG